MKKYITILIFVLTTLSIDTLAQNIIEGIVKDAVTNEAVPFVNIALVGEPVGTISDENGEFKLNVLNSALNKNLSFSSVGYKAKTFIINTLIDQRNEIALEPEDIKINEVVVTDKSEAGKKMLRSALQNIENNFVNQPFSYIGTYTSKKQIAGKEYVSKFNYTAYDSQGYNLSTTENAYQSLNYKINSVERNFKVDNYEKGEVHFDIVNGFDVMRYQLNFINEDHFADFDYRIKQNSNQDNNIAEIEFNCITPTLLSCGALNPKKYYGTILIDKNTFDVLSCNYTLVVENFTINSTSMQSLEHNQAEITAKVEYQKYNNRTSLKAINSEIKVKTNATETIYNDEITVESFSAKIPTKVNGKIYYVR